MKLRKLAIPFLLCLLCCLSMATAEDLTVRDALQTYGLPSPLVLEISGNTAACITEDGDTRSLVILEKRSGTWQVTVDNQTALIQKIDDLPQLYLDSDASLFWTYTLSDNEVLRYHSVQQPDDTWGPVDQSYFDSGFGEFTHEWDTWWSEEDGGVFIRQLIISDENDNLIGSSEMNLLPGSWAKESVCLSGFDVARFPAFLDPQFGYYFEGDGYLRDAHDTLFPGAAYVRGILKDGDLHFLSRKADGTLRYEIVCLIRGQAPHLIESSPLPEGTMLGYENFTDCLFVSGSSVSIRRLSPITAGICYIYGTGMDGLLLFGQRAAWDDGENSSHTILYGDHPWSDISGIDWTSLPHSLEEAARQIDSSRYAMVINPDPKDRLHLREKNDRDSRSQGKYYTGTPLLVLETKKDWVHVSVGRITDGGQSGWMMKKYLTIGRKDVPLQLDTSAMPQLMEQSEFLNVYQSPDVSKKCIVHRGDSYLVIGLIGEKWYHIWFPESGEFGFVLQSDLWEGNG
ncbi:MAG: SH3 domain-containing protein [Clostridia bacterium]|nr:SH3 domain-containing protein [Clostridia bacterium]